MIQDDEIKGGIYDFGLFKRMLAYGKSYKLLVGGGVALIIAAAFLQLAGPYITKLAIDKYIKTGQLSGLNFLVTLYIGVLIVTFFIQYYQTYITQYLGQRLMYDIRSEIFAHLQKLSFKFFDKNPVGRLMTRVTSDVEALNQMFTEGVVSIFGDLFLLAGIIIVMISMNTELALWTFSVIPILFIITSVFKRKVRGAFRNVRKWLAQINAFLQENITGMNIVQVFNRQQVNYRKFTEINANHTNAYIKMIFYYAVFFPAVEIVGAIALALLIWRGGILKINEMVTYGSLVAFIQYARMFFMPISDLSEKYNILQGAMASSERIFRLLDTEPDIKNADNSIKSSVLKGKIEFKNVGFYYEDQEFVLKDVSFSITPGESIAIVGHTGAGKTSLINLLTRQYDIQQGEIFIDDVEIHKWNVRNLRSHIAVVLQDVFLFSGSIIDNIRLGNKTITENQVMEACRKVAADTFIEKLPDKYHTVLNERGASLSMGQRQLLSFARAVAFNPDILILDEATSNIDTETEILIQRALDYMMKDRTSIIIAHRLSTIKHVDRILVFHKGRLKEQGAHRQLLNLGGLYSRLYQLQYKDQVIVS
ncbi:MAG: ABC transporter ATP-binding protein [Calditrichaceae bacterium]|nr:ABC transporter ATP-binding protein [Calditrichaceae bacterium]MBN2707766.1 ABC transporter ATP-binding protein [Calditrichaceae bacterium]RQV96400.1 MAG: ABC transporter ATP-binding protein [Calditrichota bacterium]